MGKMKYLGILSLVSSVIGFVFSMNTQSMAYMGPNGEMTMNWFWLGAVLSYFFLIIALLFLIVLKRNNSKLTIVDLLFTSLSIILIIITGIWTTFIIIAWQSGF